MNKFPKPQQMNEIAKIMAILTIKKSSNNESCINIKKLKQLWDLNDGDKQCTISFTSITPPFYLYIISYHYLFLVSFYQSLTIVKKVNRRCALIAKMNPQKLIQVQMTPTMISMAIPHHSHNWAKHLYPSTQQCTKQSITSGSNGQ